MFLNKVMLYKAVWVMVITFMISGFSRIAAQPTIVRGKVTDANTDEPLAYVSVFFPGTTVGTQTDENGAYYLQTADAGIVSLTVSMVGYKSVSRQIVPGTTQTIDIRLSGGAGRQLKEIIIKAGKGPRYRNRDNPAVALVRQVIAHKGENRPAAHPVFSYEKYEKISFALVNTPEKLKRNILVRKYRFLATGIDTVSREDKALLPLYLEETLSDNYYRQHPRSDKTVIRANKKVTLDNDMVDNRGVSTYMRHVYQDINIYENDIVVMTNRFLSPIADAAPVFYKFYIIDTVYRDGHPLVTLAFSPRNPTDFLFRGNMQVAPDGNYAVQAIRLGVSRHVNMNWVRDLDIRQEFERHADSAYYLSKSELSADFAIDKSRDGGIFGQRTLSFRNYSFSVPDSVFRGPSVVYARGAETHGDDYWVQSRHDSLTRSEQRVYRNIDSLQRTPSFRRLMNLATLVLAGYSKASPYVEIGPVNTFYSYNPVEGFRLRLGGRTTPALSKRIYFETYAAYGFKDEQWKYYLGTTWSFRNRSIYEFPVSSLSVNYQRDTKIPGQELQFVQEDNALLSIKRGVNDKWLYNDIYNVSYLQEFLNHFSFRLGYKNWKQRAAGGLKYINEQTAAPVPDVTTSELMLELRWAPNEEFYQGKLYRIPMPNRYPIFTFRAAAGMKGVLGGQYDYRQYTMNIYKRIYLSQLGYTDAVLEGGMLRGPVPYPLLYIHRANQTYAYQLQSYNLMNFLEFVSDRYASIQLDHCFAGFILNKMPLVKKLKLREYISAKVLCGSLGDENRPEHNAGLLRFPTDAAGNVTTYTLSGGPYIEGSIGIGNILKLFRVDLVRRFTYVDHPNVTTLGVRARVKFDF